MTRGIFQVFSELFFLAPHTVNESYVSLKDEYSAENRFEIRATGVKIVHALLITANIFCLDIFAITLP